MNVGERSESGNIELNHFVEVTKKATAGTVTK